jgi:fluoroquinolone transport system permease protein
VRWGTPILSAHLAIRFQIDAEAYYPLLVSFVVLMAPMLAGTIVGFLLLDQRDDQTLIALRVTPLTLRGYFIYRISIPTALSVIVTVFVVPVTGLLQLDVFTLLSTALGSCLLAPVYALFLGALASNKVQGFALAKAAGVLLVPPLFAYFVQPPTQLIFGIDPLFWPAKYLWMAEANTTGAWLYLSAGVVFQCALLWLLLRRMDRTS